MSMRPVLRKYSIPLGVAVNYGLTADRHGNMSAWPTS
jgi:hypothetical protein